MKLENPSPRSILLVWIGRIGDYVVSTPFIRALRRRFPGARITMVTAPAPAQLAELDPNLDEVRVLHSAMHPLRNLSLAVKVFSGFDLAVDLNAAYSRSSGFFTRLSRAPVRVSFEKKLQSRFYTHAVAHDPLNEHFLDKYRRLAGFFGAEFEDTMRVYPGRDHFDRADSLLSALGLDPSKIWVGVHPGNFKKFDHRWPEEKFRALTLKLLERKDVEIVYLAGPGEEEPVSRLLSGLGPVKALPSQPLPVSAAVLARLDLLIGSCSGPIHLAAAAGTSTFSFNSRYTLTCWQPRGAHYGVASRSWGSCRDIPVEEAWKALEPVLDGVRLESRK